MTARKKSIPTAWSKRAWHRLRAALRGRPGALILTHDYPDPDALASGWALATLFRERLGLRAILAYRGAADRPENRAMVELLGVPARELRPGDLDGRRAVVLVDASPGGGNNPLGRSTQVTAVLDNHYGASTAGLGRRLRRSCGATSTMAAELLTAAGLRPGTRLATALFFGIKTDTQALGRETSPADEAAYRWLFPMVDHRLLARVEHPRLPPYTYRMLHAALAGARRRGSVTLSRMGRLPGREGPAVAADLLVRLEGVKLCLAHGWWRGRVFFSVRSLRRGAEAWRLARAAAGAEGLAGGHSTIGAGHVPAASPLEGDKAGRRLERRFLRAARAGKKPGKKLV